MEFQDQISVIGSDSKSLTEHLQDESIENEVRESRSIEKIDQIE